MRSRSRSALALVLSACLAGPAWADSVQVTATVVNIRRAAGTGSPVVGSAGRGDVLEVLERAGDWYKVRTRAGLEGYVSARWLEPVAAPVPPASAPAAKAASTPSSPASAAAPASAKAGAVVIDHKDVGCVLAGQFPRLDACFTPADSVGRAQVQFRGDDKGPWYSVDMKSNGACSSALLPKPTKSIKSFQYFIEVVDRSFTTVEKPDAAPGQSFTPRVVERKSECDEKKMMMATSQPTGSVIVMLARDAGGKVLQAATATAQTGGAASGTVTGFSMDGVTMGGATPAAGGAGSTTAPKPASGSNASTASGGSMHTIAIVGGVVAAGGIAAAVAAGGGGGSSSSGSSGTSGSSGSTPSTGTSPGSSSPLTGHFVGLVGSGDGATYSLSVEGVTCTSSIDITTDLVQTGGTFTGTGTSVLRAFNCSVPLPPEITTVLGTGGSGSMAGTINGSAITFQVGSYMYAGTFTGSRIEATAVTTIEGFTIQSTWRQNKQ